MGDYMKKIGNFILVVFLVVFSFFYTNKAVDYLKEKDPIMQEIKKSEEKYRIEAMDAQIIGNNIISGKNGKTIDYEASYQKMKKYGTYNELLTTFKEVEPTISIKDNYDKYIVEGNRKNRSIALIFLAKEQTYIKNIINILEKKKVPGTFFIDGTFLENNISLLKSKENLEFELLSYQNEYEENFFKTGLSYLESITRKKPHYCYTEKENEDLLKLCQKLKLHTIKPNLSLKKDIYQQVKENLGNSIMISMDINNYVEKELGIVIDYIKEKGYEIVLLEDLLKESIE